MASIRLDDVSLVFRVRQQRRMTLKEFVVQRIMLRTPNPVLEVKALQNINLHLNEGDRLGIIGCNGAGKSTMLRMLAGIYPPTTGTRVVDGEIGSLFDLALGFEQDATGWENICFRGYLQGETPKTIKSKMQAIADFSELGEFLYTPLRYYSSGMVVRLAFSVATAINPEILLVDEVLSAGDLAFQRKCRQRMEDMISTARLIVMVSHDLGALQRFCNRIIWLENGTIREEGPAEIVIGRYKTEMQRLHGAEGAYDAGQSDSVRDELPPAEGFSVAA